MSESGDDHSARSRSFGAVAREYDRLRPSPPPEAVAWLLDAAVPVRRVLDLAAGTGLMTRALLAAGVEVVAVEPDDAMRAVLVERSPGVVALAGTGEAVPLPDASVDAVVVSSAWHWMDAPRAAGEVARVLRDGGRFGALWNGQDGEVAWVRELRPRDAAREAAGATGGRPHEEVVLPEGSAFTAVATTALPWEQSMAVDDVVALLGTYSQAIVASPAQRAAAEDAARAVLARRFPGRSGSDLVALPMRARGWRADRLPRA